MNPHAWIQDQHDRLLERVIDWANVNSGSGNEAGLNHVAQKYSVSFRNLIQIIGNFSFLLRAPRLGVL
ncbi:MAG TPA: hypothetical protein VN952_02595 [Chthoniobacterales bacterium]|nr:hypothetical protein [Chthoniobacterales bacterium]